MALEKIVRLILSALFLLLSPFVLLIALPYLVRKTPERDS